MSATATNRYNTLYENMRRSFTVTSENCQYSLGAFMRMKANETTHEASVPAVIERKPITSALTTIREYVSEKLTVRVAPSPERTIRNFPFRTSLAACLSAIALCTVLFSGAILGSGVLSGAQGGESVVVEYDAPTDETNEAIEEQV